MEERHNYKFTIGLSTDLDVSALNDDDAWDIIGRIARQVQQEVEERTDLDFHAWWDMK